MSQPRKLQQLLRWDLLAPRQEEALTADTSLGWGHWHSLTGSTDTTEIAATEHRNLTV